MNTSFDAQGNILNIGDHVITLCTVDKYLHFYEILSISDNGNLVVYGEHRNTITFPYLTCLKASQEQIDIHHQIDIEYDNYCIMHDNITNNGSIEQRQELGPKASKPEWLYKRFMK